MQGKTTIQLFDAKTQKEVQRVEDKNLITNAFKKYIEDYINNYHLGFLFNGYRGWIKATPLLMTRGVILFGSQLPESVETIYPTTQACIGHAGGDYSGTDIYRGDYNAAESGDIPNGYRQVWDFATDKGNGTIACACLTTTNGGNCGYKSQSTYTADYGHQGLTSTVTGTETITYASGGNTDTYQAIVGLRDNNQTVVVKVGFRGGSTPVKIRKYQTHKTGLGFKETLGCFYTDIYNTTDYTEYNLTFPNNTGTSCFIHNNALYSYTYNHNTAESVLKTYNIDTLVETSSLSLGTGKRPHDSNFFSNPMMGVLGDYLYVKAYNSTTTYKYDISDGSYVGSITAPIASTSVYKFTDNFIKFATTSSYYLYNGNEFYGPFGSSASDTWFTEPLSQNSPVFYTCGHGSALRTDAGVRVFGPALFSINNLVTPVVKDDAKTMKVTYDITW